MGTEGSQLVSALHPVIQGVNQRERGRGSANRTGTQTLEGGGRWQLGHTSPSRYLLPPSLSLCAPRLLNIKGGILGLVGFGASLGS